MISKRSVCVAVLSAVFLSGPAVALAETMNFKLLPRYSRATFKSDAPLETFNHLIPACLRLSS